MAAAPARTRASGRIAWLDAGRGVALVAMIVYHASFDLSYLGFVDWPVGGGGGWRLFAISIAGSFIALSGISLAVAARGGLNRRAYLVRLGKLALAAAAVTFGTWIAMPYPVTFGILHALTLFSVLALPFLRAPTWLLAVAIAFVLAAPFFLTHPVFQPAIFYPLGLAPIGRPSFDYEPVFPWFAAMLAGLLLARFLPLRGSSGRGGWLGAMGRHSLVIYLLHQPILMGGLAALRLAAPV